MGVKKKKKSNWADRRLLRFGRCCRGSMNGSYHRVTLTLQDNGTVLFERTDKKSYDAEPETEEYAADPEILEEIRQVFLEEKMYNWHRKNFSKLLIPDKATTTYTFEFDDGDVVFSAQIFPEKYREKLKKIEKTIQKNK